METPSASRERAAAAAADRLGDLPDGVLLDVLSRLTFREAVRTGVLSRRWRALWHAVPYPASCMDIDQQRASSPRDGESAARKRRRWDEERESRFFRLEDYGDRVTTSGDAGEPLGAFRLRATDPLLLHSQTARRWFRRALARRPLAVAIRCDASGPLFPAFSFAHHPRALTCRLRALQLHRVRLGMANWTWSDFADAIAADLPVLEDLRLEECEYYFTRIASASLQNLAIHNCIASDQDVEVLALAVPRISSLRIHGNPPPVASECEMPSLLEASLEHPAGFVGLLGSLRHARNLSLYGFAATSLLDAYDGEEPGGLLFPEFRNLSALVLDECDVGVDCQVLRRFLRNSPRLETLALRYCSFKGGGSRRKKRKASSSGDRRVPASYACRNLKSVELEYHDDQDVYELEDALEDISKEVARPIESSLQHGRRTVRISYG